MWKLYENPFYYSHNNKKHHHNFLARNQFPHDIHLPIKKARKSALMASTELERAKAQIVQLKTELEFERKARKNTESVNKKLVKELYEEKIGRETLERVCEELGKKVSESKAETLKMKREVDEERKMLRMAEVFREERVQMKLLEAKFLLEDKILELKRNKQSQSYVDIPSMEKRIGEENENSNTNPPQKRSDFPRDENLSTTSSVPENPHIKRGIKGFVEFPKVVRAMGSRNYMHLGTKLECQKALLSLVIKQKSPIRSDNLIMMS